MNQVIKSLWRRHFTYIYFIYVYIFSQIISHTISYELFTKNVIGMKRKTKGRPLPFQPLHSYDNQTNSVVETHSRGTGNHWLEYLCRLRSTSGTPYPYEERRSRWYQKTFVTCVLGLVYDWKVWTSLDHRLRIPTSRLLLVVSGWKICILGTHIRPPQDTSVKNPEGSQKGYL